MYRSKRIVLLHTDLADRGPHAMVKTIENSSVTSQYPQDGG